MRNKFFYGGNGIGIPTAKSLTMGRTWQRMLALFALIVTLGIGQMWADATITLADVTPSSNWYEVTGVGRVTNKKGNAFSNGDYNCTGTGYKTGSSYFTVQTYMAITGLQITATSTSNRTVNGIEIGDAGASSAPSSFPSGASASGTIAKKTCDQVVTINFGTTVAANKYISIGLSGNTNIFAVTFIAASVTKHSVEYKLNGGTGTTPIQADVAENASFTLHDGTTGITPPSGKQFAGWNDGTTTYAGGAAYTMGTSDVELTAQWETAKTNPTATFSDGAYVVGASALDLSGLWSSNSDGAVTYALKEASDDATVSSTSFTATKAGSYVVTASQAATATYNAIVKEATITVTWPATGAADVLFSIATGTGNTALATASKEAHSSSINTLSDFTAAGGLVVSGRGAGKDGLSTKLQTLSEKDADKYIYVTFNVADGYIFTINSVTTKVVAISTAKTIEVALSDATTSEALSYSQAKNSAAADHEFEFAGKAYEGTVKLKIYAYGATDDYRMAAPLTISGTVAVKPSPSAPSISAPTADQAAVYDLNDEIAPLAITATGYPTPTYQWYYNSSATTEGATSLGASAQTASYTPANNVASDLYYYCVANNSQGSATSHYFHVTVNAPTVPTIYTETTAMTLTSAKVATASETFTFSGANLGETAVTLVLASAVDGLTLSESSVTPTAGAIAATEVTVSYKSLLDVAEANVDLYLKQGDDILKTIALTYSSTAGIEDLTSISAATTWNWDGAADAAYGTLGQNDMIVLANADVTWDAGFNALAIAGKLQHYYRDSKYAQGNELKFNTTIPGRVTVTFSNTGGKDIARAPRITDVNGSYAPTDEADGSKNTTAKTYTHNVAAGDVLIAGFEMQEGTPANMLRYYKVEFVPTYTVAYAAGEHGSSTMTDANAYVAGDEVTLLANTFTPESGYVWSGWSVKDALDNDVPVTDGKFAMPASNVTVTAQWDDASKVAVIVETSTKYESLADAIAAATDGQTVQLLQNNDVTAQVEVAGKAITLDLAGYKIEYTGASTLASGVILVHNGASLTINDSSDPDAGSIVAGEKAYAAIALTKAGDDAANPAVLEINGGTFTGYYYAITGNGSRHNTQITINGGTFTGTAANDNNAIYHPQEGTLTINNGTFTGYLSAIEMRAGTLVINNGTFTATATSFSCNPNGSGTTTVGAAIAISQHTTKKDIAVTISGGTFEGVKAINESNPQVNDPAPQVSMAVTDGDFTGDVSTVDVHEFISGGTFDAPVTNENCAPGYIPASQDPVTGKYGVMPKDGVCLVKIEPTSQTKGTLSGLYADGDELTINLSSGKNLGGSGKYIGVKATENFQEGDVLHLNMSTYQNSQNATAYVYADKDASVFLFDTEEKCDENKDYYITMPAAVNGHKELYIVRTDGNKWNGGPSIMEVTRAMKPMLTAITIDGRDGVIDEANKTVAVQIPFEADLAALAVVPTIVRNAPHATTPEAVISNEGAWIEGDNTYRVMDKDGDYTDYTITLTRDVLKHAVKFYDGETLLETLEVEDGTSIAAGDVPADPEKEDYIFQGWAETAGGDVVEVTSFTISAAKNFYAKWAADGALKLINKTSGAVNEDGYFITGVTATEANSEKAAAWGGTQGATISGTNQLNKVVQYNATTNQTKLQIKVYNTNNSDKYVYIHKIIEGNTTEETVETLTATSKTVVPSEYYEFNNTKNRSFYITTNSTDVKILQVKVIDDGATPMKQAGEAGYSLNLNKGRALYYANSDVTLEGLALQSASNYNVISSTEFQTKKNFSFSISTPVLLKVTTNTAKYYVSQDPNEDGTTATAVTDAGTAEFNLTTTGTWYLVPSTTSNVKYTNIAFELPKCEKPVFNALTNSDLCEGDAFEALDGTGTVTDGGSISYKWYAEGGTDVLGTNATYTPEADGNYYVVALHHVDGFSDNEATSDVVSVTHFASAQITTAPTDVRQEVGEVATLNVVATGKAPLSYQWYTCDDAEGNNPVIIIGAEEDSYSVTVTDGLDQYYKVVVSSGCGEASAIARIVEWVALPQLSVSATTTWDWVNAGENIKLTGETTPKKNEECVLANVKVDGKMPTNDATFNSQALLFYGENVRAKDGGRYYASLGHIKFNAAVSGKVTVEFSDNGTNNRKLKINDALSESSESKTDIKTFSAVVPAGEVTLMGVNSDGTESDQYIRISKIIFEVTPDVSDADYTRDVRQGYYGTICLPNGGVMVGASIYEVAYFGGTSEKVFFDEIVSGEMIAGRPYIFLPREDVTTIGVYYTDEANAAAGSRNGLIGYIGSGDFAIPQNDGNYVIKNNMYLYVNSPSYIVSNRAYLRLSDIPTTEPALAPGCRRIAIGGVHAPTGLDAINADAEQAQKMLIDGKIYIIRGGHVYDAAGQLVK